MKTFAVISLLTTVALAQSSSPSAAVPTATGNPYVTDNISNKCKEFLDAFNKDTSVTACTNSLIQATKDYGPGGSSGSPSKTEVKGAIDSICTGSASSACPDSLIRGKLTDFYASCSEELTSKPNKQVRDVYDTIYILTPLKKALCSKDDAGEYCAISGSDASSSGYKAALAGATGLDADKAQDALYYTPSNSNSLSRRAEDAIAANLTTFRATNLPYLFRQSNMDTPTLCTTCTRNILTSYFNFESEMPFAPGLDNSALLGGQNGFVRDIKEKCGDNFLNGAVQAAGGISNNPAIGSGAVKDVSERFSSVFAVVAAGLTVVISSLV